MKKTCLNCGRGEDRPAIFRNEDHCSENCRKALENKASEEEAPEWPPNRCPSLYEDEVEGEAGAVRCIYAKEIQHDVHTSADGRYQWRDHGHGIKERLRRLADRPQA